MSSWLAAILIVGANCVLGTSLDTPSNASQMSTPANHASSEVDDDAVPTLSQNALLALQEFYAEKMEIESQFHECAVGVRNPQKTVIPENWVSARATIKGVGTV